MVSISFRPQKIIRPLTIGFPAFLPSPPHLERYLKKAKGIYKLEMDWPRILSRWTCWFKIGIDIPEIEIAVSVYLFEVCSLDGRYAAENLLVRKLVMKSVHFDGHVTRPPWTIIEIQITLRHKIDVMKYETLPIGVLESLFEADIEQQGSIELFDRFVLFNNVN